MNSVKPPRLAAWILQHFGPELNHEALTGDLNEAYQQGRPKGWYWRQVASAIRWRLLVSVLLFSVLLGWWLTSPIVRPTRTFLSRPIDMAVITATYFASVLVPGMMRGKLRALVVLLIAAIFGLLWRYNPDVAERDWIFFWVVACNFVLTLHRKGHASPPYHLTWRELFLGDQDAEKERMIAKMEQSMREETDPQMRRAYAESIAALQRHPSKDAKAT